MVVFALWSVWLLSVPFWDGAARSKIVAGPPGWAYKLNPFVLAYAPYAWPGYVDVKDVAIFVAAAFFLSVAAVVFAIHRLRATWRRRPVSPDASGPGAAGRELIFSPGGPALRSTATPCSGGSGTAIGHHAWLGWSPGVFICRPRAGHGCRHRRRHQSWGYVGNATARRHQLVRRLIRPLDPECHGPDDPDRGARAGQPGRTLDHSPFHSPHRAGQMVGDLPPRTTAAYPPGPDRPVRRRGEP